MAGYVENADHGVRQFKAAVRKARLISNLTHLVPLAALAGAVGVGESLLSIDSLWLVMLFAVLVFLVVDYWFVGRILVRSLRRAGA
jgi:hypothetical protein